MNSVDSTRVEIISHQSDLGCWRAAQRLAKLHLRDFILGFFASEGFLPTLLYERHLPSREVSIILNFAAPHRIAHPSASSCITEHRSAWITALQHRHHIREAFGARDFMVIRLTPIGAQMILGMPMDLLTDRILALDDIDRRFSQLLMKHTEDTQDWLARFDIVEQIIATRLSSAPPPPAGLQHAWRMLQSSPNHVDLARLPKELGCSRRHLITQFHKCFGMTPKMIARISRFHLTLAAIHRLEQRDASIHVEGKPYLDCVTTDIDCRVNPTAIRWTDLALDCGYYDQSHLINEFRAFSGMSPLELLRQTRHE